MSGDTAELESGYGPAAPPGDNLTNDFQQETARSFAELATARVFTTDQWSDYLIYRNYPQQRDFIDGQHQYYGEKHVADYVATLDGSRTWAGGSSPWRIPATPPARRRSARPWHRRPGRAAEPQGGAG